MIGCALIELARMWQRCISYLRVIFFYLTLVGLEIKEKNVIEYRVLTNYYRFMVIREAFIGCPSKGHLDDLVIILKENFFL